MIPAYLSFLPLSNASPSLDSSKCNVPGSGCHQSSTAMSPAKVERLSFLDIKSARKTLDDAFKDDPLQEYIQNKESSNNSGFLKSIISILYISIELALAVLSKTAFTVGHGKGLSIYSPAPSSAKKPRPTPLRSLLELILKLLFYVYFSWLSTPERRKRREELEDKMAKSIQDNLGKKADEMVYLAVLATSPEHQGKGYGSALVKVVTDIADAEGRETYLFSSNINNTPFYNSCGFYEVANVVFGGDNPTWNKKPVLVPLMVRAAKRKDLGEKAMLMV